MRNVAQMFNSFISSFYRKKNNNDLEQVFITRRLSKIAWPLSINTLTFYLLTVTDSVFIGHYDSKGLDILNTILIPFSTLNQLMDYMHMGTVIPVSQAFGAKEYHQARRFAENGFFVYSIVGIVFWLFWMLFAKPIYGFLTPDPNTQKIALDYIIIVAYTYLVQGIGYKGIQAVFAATGFTKPFMVSGIVQVLINMVANRVLIYGDFFFPELGIAGAAWGTLFSSIVGFLVMFWFFKKQKTLVPTLKGILKPQKNLVATTIKMGFPVGIDMVLWGLGGVFLVWMINQTDPSLNRFMFFFITLPEFGFRVYSGYILAITNLCGRAFGARNFKKLFRIMRFGLRDALAVIISISFIYLLFPDMIARLFTSDTDTINLLKLYIPLMVFIIVPRVFWEVFNAVLHGLGITVWGMFVQMVGLTAIVLQAYFFIGSMHLGVLGVFIIYVLDEVLRMIFMGGRLLYASSKLKAYQKEHSGRHIPREL
ncbi:MAG: MATE family efflux transporter [Brevinemataceae bacterium]